MNSALLLIWTISEVAIALLTRTKRSEGNVQDRGSLPILWIVIFAYVTACQFIQRTPSGYLFNGAENAGTVVFLAGLAVRWTAIFSLGKSFSANVAIQDSQTIHRTGFYRFVRHPSYTGLILIFLAIGLGSNRWLGLLVAVIPTTAAILYRIHVEEAALIRAFGDEYLSYSKSTKRLIPAVY